MKNLFKRFKFPWTGTGSPERKIAQQRSPETVKKNCCANCKHFRELRNFDIFQGGCVARTFFEIVPRGYYCDKYEFVDRGTIGSLKHNLK